ncbi:MAG: HD-GYP domain-containing protein [Firmicutes bacterium HGW-Firmicutes-21]|nr:MAG: HD-GYP domain-containing protein [Firmicutes bacterium HGW-Firmicutes-21]
MDGIFIKKEKVDFLTEDSKSDLFLLLERNDLEIMLQTVHKDSLIWITPTAEKEMTEFFYIINGSLSLEFDDETITLNENDCFYTSDLKGKVLLKSNTDLKILYVATDPVFRYLDNFYEELNYLLDKITEKDEYTKNHCKRVADYCLFISQKLKCTETILDNIVVASLFHDVGKCFIADEILQKNGRLTKEEFKEIYKHPTHTKKLLSGKFSDDVTAIAYEHHERLDGSGYPCGLKGEQISLSARIIAVADSFDAMTTKRPYNTPKTFAEAANELFSLCDKYDITVTTALKELVDSGELIRMLNEVTNDGL